MKNKNTIAESVAKIAEWCKIANKIDDNGDMHPAQENGTYVEGLIDAMLIVRGDVKIERGQLVKNN